MNARTLTTTTPLSTVVSQLIPIRRWPQPNKKTLTIALTLCLSFGAGLGCWNLYQGLSQHETTDDAYVDGHMSDIASHVSGTVSKVWFTDNQLVKAGQILVSLDSRDYDLKVLQARAALEKAQRQVNEDSAGVTVTATTASADNSSAQGDALKAQAAIASAAADLQQCQDQVGIEQAKLSSLNAQEQEAALDLQRYKALSGEGAVSSQQFDQIKTQYEMDRAQAQAQQAALNQAQAKVIQAQASQATARAGLKTSQASRAQAQAAAQQTNVKSDELAVDQANVDQANADLQNALLQDSYTTITAPLSGRVGKKSVELGEQIQSGQSLLNIIPEDDWITANFKETQIGRMHKGEAVTITMDAFPGKKFSGQLDSLSPASGAKYALLPPDNASGNFTKVVQRLPVKITFASASIAQYKDLIVPGLSATVSVALQ